MPAIATTAAILAEPPAPVVGYGTCGLARVQIGEAPFPFLRCPLPQGWGCGRVAAAAEARGWWWSQDKKRARVRRVGEKFELRTCAFARIRVVSAAKLSPSSPREKRPPGRRKPTVVGLKENQRINPSGEFRLEHRSYPLRAARGTASCKAVIYGPDVLPHG